MLPVRSTEDVIELMNIGLNNRAISSTAMNERSSRSHSVLTVHVRGKDLKTGATSHGSLHLVDLAGSERVDRSEVTGDALREAQHINKSLSALGDVIFALAQKSSHVPYRNSKLTQVLQSSLGGRAKTLMFVQINPDVSSYSETLSTLKFAERVSGVELGAARSNKEGRDKDLMDQMASLKDALAKKDEEIERLQELNDPRSPVKLTLKHSTSFLKNGPSSPSARSIASSPRGSPTVSSARRLSRCKPTSPTDPDNSSDHSDAASNATDESLRSLNDLRSQNDDFSIGDGDDTDADADADADERPSEVSDGVLSVGTETDSTSEANLSLEKRKEKPKTPTRASQQSRLASQTGVSRLSQVRTTGRSTAALKTPASGSSSPVTPASGRRRL
ncbi:hypothetical protein Cgig2_013244 [Carnegiea gigantea]|uniref:Kinesin-like protein n=1 Tax=Carnegiea gigantea TaxID=171969 RepID=A0A9Q1JF73_9CARY|nr:hypothetical protein Cgig2_013244 [Carnegiea gigantea]